jgi:GDP-L-fucose synthase
MTNTHRPLIAIFGGNGFVGRACLEYLSTSYSVIAPSSNELDLTNLNLTRQFFSDTRPDIVVNAAGRVGGIAFNQSDNYEQFRSNVLIGISIASAARDCPPSQILNLSSSCVYPVSAKRPLKEESMSGADFEPTNAGYALAKFSVSQALSLLSQTTPINVTTLIPCNVYGPGDCYDDHRSHVMAALIKKTVIANLAGSPLAVWGTGTPLREFMYIDDFVRAISFCIEQPQSLKHHRYLNVGSGVGVSIRELVPMICEAVGFDGQVDFDRTKPDGVYDKTMDIGCLNSLGWTTEVSLQQGIKLSVSDFLRTLER